MSDDGTNGQQPPNDPPANEGGEEKPYSRAEVQGLIKSALEAANKGRTGGTTSGSNSGGTGGQSGLSADDVRNIIKSEHEQGQQSDRMSAVENAIKELQKPVKKVSKIFTPFGRR